MAIKDPQDQKRPKPLWTPFSVHGIWKPPEGTSSAPRKLSPHIKGKVSLSSMNPVLKVPQVVHIWYNIPLCTIFSQQSNGHIFRTKLSYPKSSSKSITNFEGGLFSYSVWQSPGGYQKIIQAPQPPGLAEVRFSFSHQDYSKGNSQRLSIFSISVKASSTKHSLDNSIGPYRQ
ncbi:hypothetical protein O181_121227 [Austropuccinia psidii MF-1]|uniref:Uncharacterized protein n=1 Tax=Austropuccinia psidii MF-1 TaxID=1389203 RepID=A0A9Q3Q376_9BASI|nr:hypothetical protein [Austropuccinia psidii MF-1]